MDGRKRHIDSDHLASISQDRRDIKYDLLALIFIANNGNRKGLFARLLDRLLNRSSAVAEIDSIHADDFIAGFDPSRHCR